MRFPRPALSAVLVLALAAPCAATDLADIRKRGELLVLVVDGSPAFFSVNPKETTGLEREILGGFARLHKVEIRVVEIPSWDVLLPALLDGKGDLVAGGATATEARARLVGFSTEVFPTRDVVVTRRPHRVVRTLEELREERVGTIKGTAYAETVAAAKVPPRNVDDSIAATGFAEALKSGRVTAIVDGVEDALRLQQADPELQIGLFLGPPQSLAFGVRKGDAELRRALDDYLANLRKTPTWSRLVVKYFGSSALEVLKKARAE